MLIRVCAPRWAGLGSGQQFFPSGVFAPLPKPFPISNKEPFAVVLLLLIPNKMWTYEFKALWSRISLILISNQRRIGFASKTHGTPQNEKKSSTGKAILPCSAIPSGKGKRLFHLKKKKNIPNIRVTCTICYFFQHKLDKHRVWKLCKFSSREAHTAVMNSTHQHSQVLQGIWDTNLYREYVFSYQ